MELKPPIFRNLFIIVVAVGLSGGLHAQRGFPNYYKFIALSQKGDSLYNVHLYKKAAETYLLASQTDVEKGIEISTGEMLYKAACSFSMAHQTTAAINCLKTLVLHHKYADYERIKSERDFSYLSKKSSFQKVLIATQKNQTNQDWIEKNKQRRTTPMSDTGKVIFYPLTSFANQFISQDSFPFISINHQNFRIYFSADSYAAKHLNEIKKEVAEAFNRAVSILSTNPYCRGINILLFDSAEEMKEVTGIFARGGIAYPSHDIALFPYTPTRRPQFRHELFHILSNNLWGTTNSRLLNEGAAVFADEQCFIENPIHKVNALLLSKNYLVPLQSIISDFDALTQKNDVIAYLHASSIFKYLFEKYGIDKMKKLWLEGFDFFEEIYGLPLDKFESEWLKYIKSIPVPDNIDENKLLKEGCG